MAKCEEKTFLQSWNWGEFNKLEGNKIWRFGIYTDGGLTSVVLVVKVSAKRGTFLFVPHGPSEALAKEDGPITKLKIESMPRTKPKVLVRGEKLKVLELLLTEIKKIAKEEKADFIRVAPVWERSEENVKIFKEASFKEGPIHIHPEVVWELDIAKSEEELLAGMRKTTRYLIRQAEKNNDIKIIKSQNKEDLELFNKVYQETALRHRFAPFSFQYLKNEFEAFAQDNNILIFLGKYKEKVVSSAIILFWQGTGFYHQGASLPESNKTPVSYLLQWEAIKEAKKRGCQIYNFWGVAEKNWKLEIGNWKFGVHPWYGLTLFKMGFGGYKKEYVKTHDYPLSSRYFLTYLFEKARKIKRRL